MKSHFVLALFSLAINSSAATELERARIAELKQKIDAGINLHQVMGRELPLWFQEFKEEMTILDGYWILSDEEICAKLEEIRQKIQDLEDLLDKIKLAWNLKGEQLVTLTEILHHTKYDTTGLKNFTHEEEDCKKPLHDYIQGANTTHIEEGEIIKEYNKYILDNLKRWEEHPCDCVWGEWEEWTACTKTCGEGGTRNRQRKIAKPAINGGLCLGSPTDNEECNAVCCPVDCTWNEWSEWSECPAHCPYCPTQPGDGKINRHRSKNEHVCGGAPCKGEAEESQDCNIVAILLEKVGQLENDVNGCRDENENLRADNDNLRLDNENLHDENDRLQLENDNLRAELENCQEENDNLHEKLCSMLHCQNGGVCIQGACQCREGYMGTSCEVKGCPSGEGVDFEKTLEFITIKKTYAEAKKHCEDKGKKLISVDSAEENEFISKKLQGQGHWLGATRRQGNTWSYGLGEATWPAAKADESDCVYRNWHKGEPNNHGGIENCIEIVGHIKEELGEWHDISCNRKFAFICEALGCSELNCQNGGVCIQGACQCKEGYTGKSCEVQGCPKPWKQTACYGMRMDINCPNSRKIKIISANYGRTNKKICSAGRPAHQVQLDTCKSSQPQTNNIVMDNCDNKNQCSIEPKNLVTLGDPCWGTFKYLEVHYLCGGDGVDGVDFEKTLEFMFTGMSQPDAQKYCEEKGKKLVTVDSAKKNEFITRKLQGKRAWISGIRVSENTWSWGPGEPAWPTDAAEESDCMYRNWYRGTIKEPNNWKNSENCIEINRWEDGEGQWNDENCVHKLAVVCEAP